MLNNLAIVAAISLCVAVDGNGSSVRGIDEIPAPAIAESTSPQLFQVSAENSGLIAEPVLTVTQVL